MRDPRLHDGRVGLLGVAVMAPLLFLFLGAAVLALTAYRLFALHDTIAEDKRRLARAAWREAARQEQDAHPVSRTDWEPYRRPRPGTVTRVLWREVEP